MARVAYRRNSFLQNVVDAENFQVFKKWLLRFMREKIYQGMLYAKTLAVAQKIRALQIARGWEGVQGSIVWAGSVLLFPGCLLFVTVRDKSLDLPLV